MSVRLTAAALIVGASAGSSPCCETCEAPKVKYFSVDTPHGHCGECCMDPKHFGIFKIFERNLTVADGTTCADLGWPKYDSTVTHGFGPLSMTLDLYNHAGLQADSPANDVTLYKISGDECGQATLDEKYEQYAVKFAGLKEGTCADQGYSVADGSQTLKVPVLGDIKIEKFKKPAMTVTVEDQPCCKACEAPKVKYFSVDTPHGHCGECCMDPKHFGIFKIFERNLTLADGTTCADLGWPKYDSTVTHGFGPLSMTLDLYNHAGLQADSPANDVTLYKVSGDECGQATLDEKYEQYAVKFAGLKEGTCADQGYSVADGSQTLKVPVLGDIKIEKFKKPAMTVTVEDQPCCKACEAPKVKYFSVDTPHGHCGECCMDPKHFGIFKIFERNLTVADGTTCADLGWPKYDSTVTHGFGPLSMTLDLYDHAGSSIIV